MLLRASPGLQAAPLGAWRVWALGSPQTPLVATEERWPVESAAGPGHSPYFMACSLGDEGEWESLPRTVLKSLESRLSSQHISDKDHSA